MQKPEYTRLYEYFLNSEVPEEYRDSMKKYSAGLTGSQQNTIAKEVMRRGQMAVTPIKDITAKPSSGHVFSIVKYLDKINREKSPEDIYNIKDIYDNRKIVYQHSSDVIPKTRQLHSNWVRNGKKGMRPEIRGPISFYKKNDKKIYEKIKGKLRPQEHELIKAQPSAPVQPTQNPAAKEELNNYIEGLKNGSNTGPLSDEEKRLLDLEFQGQPQALGIDGDTHVNDPVLGKITKEQADNLKQYTTNPTIERINSEIKIVDINKINNALELKQQQATAVDLGNSKWGRRASYAIGALMATGSLVSALNSSRGQQSNAQLYGQQPLY